MSGFSRAPYVAAEVTQGLELHVGSMDLWVLKGGYAGSLFGSMGDPRPVLSLYVDFLSPLYPGVHLVSVAPGLPDLTAIATENAPGKRPRQGQIHSIAPVRLVIIYAGQLTLPEPMLEDIEVNSSVQASNLVTVTELELTPEELLGPLAELEKRFAPAHLFVSGRLSKPLSHPRVAIVGTRTATSEGLRTAKTLATNLARRGVTIVSGLAQGIDTAAHAGAIEAGGKTIAVLGTSLRESYPPQNADLQRVIQSEHLCVSQFAGGYPIRRENFVLRNRTMALIADASIIVESGEKGGALHQGWEAIRLGRPLFIHKTVLSDSKLMWPRDMQQYGAVEFEEASDLLAFVPGSRPGLIVDGIG